MIEKYIPVVTQKLQGVIHMETALKTGKLQHKILAIITFILMSIMLMLPTVASANVNGIAPSDANGGVAQFTISGNPDLNSVIGNMQYNTVEAAAGKQISGSEVFTASGNTLYVNFNELNNGSTATQRRVLGAFVESLNQSTISSESKTNLMNQISAHDKSINKLMIPIIMDATSADLYEASKVVNPFLPIVRLIFGILTIVISILLIGSTIIDIIFITFPLAREVFNKEGQGGGGGKISWVTSEANSVINETEGGGGSGGYKNALFLYFKRRLVSYIVLAFCLLYLVLGEIGGLIGWLLTLGEGLTS